LRGKNAAVNKAESLPSFTKGAKVERVQMLSIKLPAGVWISAAAVDSFEAVLGGGEEDVAAHGRFCGWRLREWRIKARM